VEETAVKKEYPLRQIYFYLTEGCNLGCRHCWLSPGLQNEKNVYPSLSLDVFNSILEQAISLGLKGVKLTGGEPLMHPGITEILKIIYNHELTLAIETNGVLCTTELAKEITNGKNAFVSVSIDGTDARTHEWIRGIKGCFNAALEGIKNLVNVGIKPQIIMTVMRSNSTQLEKMVRMAESLGVESIKFNLVQPTGRGKKLNEEGDALTLNEIFKIGEWVNNTLSLSTKVDLFFDIPPAFQSMAKMFGKSGRGGNKCGIKEIIGVLSSGHYALCGIGTHMTELIFGDATKDRLEDIWKNNEILIELREGIPSRFEGICGRCHLHRLCAGTCIAQNYYRSKSLWKAFWMCEEAYNVGIFPKSRIKPK